MFKLATKWPLIMNTWRHKEQIFLSYPYKIGKLSLKYKLNLLAFSLFFFSFGRYSYCMNATKNIIVNAFSVEHGLYLATAIHNCQMQVKYCRILFDTFFENFLKQERPQVLYYIPFAYWQLPIYEWSNISMSFVWTYVDMLIVVCSIGLTTRVDQLNGRIKDILSEATPPRQELWKEFRLHYILLCDLVQFVDSHISLLIFISTSHNMFAVCIVIFNSFKYIYRYFRND